MRSLLSLPSLPSLPLKNSHFFSNPIPSLSFQTTHLSILPKPTFKLHSSSSSPLSINLEDPESAAEIASEKFDWYSKWYPVAPVCDLDKRAPRGLTILGLDVVVWWDREGDRWQVFDDRCPHRLAPLSEGRIDQWGRLQCVYHGWCFDGSGGCKYIPQAPPDGPPCTECTGRNRLPRTEQLKILDARRLLSARALRNFGSPLQVRQPAN